MNRLTVIIPFLNENVEVRKTLESFCSYALTNIDIILINDASNDFYDYKAIADEFNALYLEHSSRKGVAASREDGIKNCKTAYFLLLDAHMRAYQMGWDRQIIEVLESDPTSIFCCCTKRILHDNTIIRDTHIGCGCMLNLLDLSYRWLNFNDLENRIIDIPCILGASYACSKQYWDYLHGLEGLRSYGLDEQFVSLKAFLAGGKCKLIGKIVFGHIFRDLSDVPYIISNKDYIFNLLYIAEVLYTIDIKILFFKLLRQKVCNADLYNDAVNEIGKSNILEQKKYYSQIFVKSLDEFEKYNSSFANFVI